MTLKEKLAKARAVLEVKTELATYKSAIDNNHKFSEFYVNKAAELQIQLDILTQE